MKKILKKWYVILVTVIVVSISVYGLFFRNPLPPTRYATDTVKRQTLTEKFTETGTVFAKDQQIVNAQSEAYIEEILVKNGQGVVAGQQLLKIRPILSEKEKSEAFTQYKNAENALRNAEYTKTQAQNSVDQAQVAVLQAQSNVNQKNAPNAINPTTGQPYTAIEQQIIDATLTQAQSQLASAKKQLADQDAVIGSSRAQLHSSYKAYEATNAQHITAQIDGVVDNLNISVGQRIMPNQASPQTLMIITQEKTLQVKIKFTESSVNKVRVGVPAIVTLSSAKDRQLTGMLESLDRVGSVDQGTTSFYGYVTLSGDLTGVRVGATAKVSFETNRAENVLTIPTSAIKSLDGQKFVEVFDKDDVRGSDARKTMLIPVETGIKDDGITEIKSGVSEGDEIVTSTNIGSAPDKGGPVNRPGTEAGAAPIEATR